MLCLRKPYNPDLSLEEASMPAGVIDVDFIANVMRRRARLAALKRMRTRRHKKVFPHRYRRPCK